MGSFVWLLHLGPFAGELAPGNFSFGAIASKDSIRNFSLGTFTWELAHGYSHSKSEAVGILLLRLENRLVGPEEPVGEDAFHTP